MKRITLADFTSYFFILLFVYTGATKLMETQLFKEQLISSPLLGPLAGFISWALPIGEILLGIAFLIPRLQRKAFYATLVVMALFTIYVLVIFFMDNHLSCSCGGIIEELTPKQHIVFNSACVVLSILGKLATQQHEPFHKFKWLTNSSAVLLFVLIGWTIFTAFSMPPKAKTGMEGRLLPSFSILLPDSLSRLDTRTISDGQPFVIFEFSPTCKHCQAETGDILKHMALLRNVRMYYVTSDPFSEMKIFYRYFQLQNYPNIIIGRDETFAFGRYFKVHQIPYAAIFDSHKRLKEVFPYQTTAQEIARAVAE